MKHKTNPKKIGRTQSDVDKARKQGQADGLEVAMAIFFMAILDKGFVKPERIPELWDAVLYVSGSIVKGYINIFEQKKILKEEYGITFSDLKV